MIRIFIDQGHNPVNPNAGAEANGLREQDITYEIGIRLAELLRRDPLFSVRLSRNSPDTVLGTTDNTSSLAARVNAANSWPADYFISLHCNTNPNPQISGSEAYVYRRAGEAYSVAEYLLRGLNQVTGLPNLGIRIEDLYVLRRTTMPAVLVEMGFLTNRGDALLLSSQPDLFAQGLYRGLKEYFG